MEYSYNNLNGVDEHGDGDTDVNIVSTIVDEFTDAAGENIANVKKHQNSTQLLLQSLSAPPPIPFNDLIDCTSYSINFAARKFINIGIDPLNNFDVIVHIISASQYVKITTTFLKRIFGLMGNILAVILDRRVRKTKNRIFLKDEAMQLYKIGYKGENMLVIESRVQTDCRVLLNRENLLSLANLEWCIFNCIARKTSVVKPMVLVQITEICEYLEKEMARRRVSHIFDEMHKMIGNLNDATMMKEIPQKAGDSINLLSEIKLMASRQLTERLYGGYDVCGIYEMSKNDGIIQSSVQQQLPLFNSTPPTDSTDEVTITFPVQQSSQLQPTSLFQSELSTFSQSGHTSVDPTEIKNFHGLFNQNFSDTN